MPQFYPEKDADFYVERLVDGYHDARPFVLRKIRARNCVRWFREPTDEDQNHSIICSWGEGKTFENNTGMNCKNFIKSRLRKNCKLPTPGRRGLWKITRLPPVGMNNLRLHTWNIKDWLESEKLSNSEIATI
ncbi:hypothetical protein PVAND_008983 [Polypedilum vanderplanki]|uniref:Uncharacterized protein n=1 Tax=Polypedilum vanderplanki TaxID=319348 RepID=A0A9J6CC29_POLVA|nr:hypothetical protein PVAND_008983 [Polypedilum vanderplanki]